MKESLSFARTYISGSRDSLYVSNTCILMHLITESSISLHCTLPTVQESESAVLYSTGLTLKTKWWTLKVKNIYDDLCVRISAKTHFGRIQYHSSLIITTAKSEIYRPLPNKVKGRLCKTKSSTRMKSGEKGMTVLLIHLRQLSIR